MTSSQLCVRALAADFLVPGYGLSPATACQHHRFGVNDTYIVASDSTRFILRIYRPGWRSAADIAYELDALDHLAAKGVSVSTAVPRLDGRRVTTLAAPEGERPAVLFTLVPGQELQADEPNSAALGRTCALVHAATEDFTCQHQRFKLDLAHLLDEPLAIIRPHLARRPLDWEFLQALADRLRQRLHALQPLDRGFCHGDLHGGNAHRQGEGLTLFDFDCCGHGCRAFDISVFRWYSRPGVKGWSWPAYLAGYRQARSLSQADLSAADLFVPIRRIWLMGVHLRSEQLWGFLSLGENYFDPHIKMLREMEVQYLV